MLEKSRAIKFWQNQAMRIYVHGNLQELQEFCGIYLNTTTGKEFGMTLIWDAIALARKTKLEEMFT